MRSHFSVFAIVLSVIVSESAEAKLNKKFHLITNNRVNWHEALHYCNSHGIRLAAFYSKEENDQVLQQIRESGINDYFWTAGTCLGNEPYFYWMGNEKPMAYTNWATAPVAPNQPDNFDGNENCIEIAGHWEYKWNDITCEKKMFFVCEEKLSTLPGEESLHGGLSLKIGTA